MRTVVAGTVMRRSRMVRPGCRRRRNRTACAVARGLMAAVRITNFVFVAVIPVARFVAALEALADEIAAAFVAIACLLGTLAIVTDDLGVAFVAGALMIAAALVVADNQLMPLILVGADLGIAVVSVADDAVVLAVLITARLLRGTVAAEADNLLPVPFGLGAELGGDGYDFGDFVADGAVRQAWRAGCDGAGGGARDGASEGVVRRTSGRDSAMTMMTMLIAVVVVVIVMMVFINSDV